MKKGTVGVITCTSMADWIRQMQRIHNSFAKRTGYRLTLSNPMISEICFRCAHVKSECICKEVYAKQVN